MPPLQIIHLEQVLKRIFPITLEHFLKFFSLVQILEKRFVISQRIKFGYECLDLNLTFIHDILQVNVMHIAHLCCITRLVESFVV